MKNTRYSHVKISVMASRDQLCVHPEVSQETNNAIKVHMCRAKVQARSCYYHTNIDNKKDFVDNGILDIEDLMTLGNICNFTSSKAVVKPSTIGGNRVQGYSY